MIYDGILYNLGWLAVICPVAFCRILSSVYSFRMSPSLWSPNMFERPLDPTSIGIRVDVYLAFNVLVIRSWYQSSFLVIAASWEVLKQTVSSTSVMVFWSSFHHTMSSLRSVAAMWVGNDSHQTDPRSWMMLAIACRTRLCRSTYCRRSSVTLH